jgi:hypothetical protein
VADGQVWVCQRGDAALTVVTPGNAGARELRVQVTLLIEGRVSFLFDGPGAAGRSLA